jgi:phospholipase C
LVSPFAKIGFIDNTQLDFTSMLKFIEENWQVSSLASRDATAHNILTAFDFTQTPRHPEFLSSTWAPVKLVKKDPTLIIYSFYGFASLLSILVVGFAFWKQRRPQYLKQENSSR